MRLDISKTVSVSYTHNPEQMKREEEDNEDTVEMDFTLDLTDVT